MREAFSEGGGIF